MTSAAVTGTLSQTPGIGHAGFFALGIAALGSALVKANHDDKIKEGKPVSEFLTKLNKGAKAFMLAAGTASIAGLAVAVTHAIGNQNVAYISSLGALAAIGATGFYENMKKSNSNEGELSVQDKIKNIRIQNAESTNTNGPKLV